MIDRVVVTSGAAVGDDAEATATGYSPRVTGRVLAVEVAYSGSPPGGTCDATLRDQDAKSDELIVSLTDSATDQVFYPRRALADGAATPIADPAYGEYVVCGRLVATIAQVNAGDAVTFTVWMER